MDIKAHQNGELVVTYAPKTVVTPPVLSASFADGLRVNGTVGAKVQLQFRALLDQGGWTDLPGKTFTLGALPLTALTHADGKANPGFYRVVVVP